MEMANINRSESEEGSEEGEGGSQYGSESGSGSGSSEEEGEEESDGEEEEDEPVLKYKRFAKEVVASLSGTDSLVQICCISVHPKVSHWHCVEA